MSKNVVSRILLNLLRVFHCLVASVLVTSEQNQVPDQIASGLEILKIRKTIFVILVFVGKNMFDIVSVSLSLTVDVFFKVRRIAHQHVHIGSEACKNVQHIPFGELIQTKTGDSFNGHAHTTKRTNINHTNCFAICIANVLHYMEQLVFIRIPVGLFEIQNSDGSEVIYELRRHPYLLLYYVISVIIFDGGNGEHGLIGQVPVCVIENLFISRREFTAVIHHS